MKLNQHYSRKKKKQTGNGVMYKYLYANMLITETFGSCLFSRDRLLEKGDSFCSVKLVFFVLVPAREQTSPRTYLAFRKSFSEEI